MINVGIIPEGIIGRDFKLIRPTSISDHFTTAEDYRNPLGMSHNDANENTQDPLVNLKTETPDLGVKFGLPSEAYRVPMSAMKFPVQPLNKPHSEKILSRVADHHAWMTGETPYIVDVIPCSFAGTDGSQ